MSGRNTFCQHTIDATNMYKCQKLVQHQIFINIELKCVKTKTDQKRHHKLQERKANQRFISESLQRVREHCLTGMQVLCCNTHFLLGMS